jgi:hypothetical protein
LHSDIELKMSSSEILTGKKDFGIFFGSFCSVALLYPTRTLLFSPSGGKLTLSIVCE